MASSAKTDNLNLNLWASSDYVLREDFNNDNAILDSELGGLRSQSARVTKSLAEQQYNIMSLFLLNYYENRYLGTKKALMVNVFNRTASVDMFQNSGWDYDENCVFGSNEAGQEDTSFLHSGSGYTVLSSTVNEYSYQKIYVKKIGKLKSFSIQTQRTTSTAQTVTATVELLATDASGAPTGEPIAQRSVSETLTNYSSTTKTYTLSNEVEIQPGIYIMRFGWFGTAGYSTPILNTCQLASSGGVYSNPGYCCDKNGAQLSTSYQSYGVSLNITAVTSSLTPTVTMKTQNLRTNYSTATAFVHCNGMDVDVEISGDGGGTWKQMEHTGTAEVENFDGRICPEMCFALDDVPAAPNNEMTLRLSLHGSASSPCEIYDFGLVVA